MTRKDYVLIAEALRLSAYDFDSSLKMSDYASVAMHKMCCENVAQALGRDNPRFDRARFLEACGVAS